MVRRIAVAIWLAATLTVDAQQPDAPARVGSAGVAPLRVETFVAPVYPQIAHSARVSGEVWVEATIGIDGKVRDVRFTRSIPLLDQAVEDALRRWRFETPIVQGVAAPVRVPVTVRFVLTNRSSLFVPTLGIESIPGDFTVAFASNCPTGDRVSFETATGWYERTSGDVSVRARLYRVPDTVLVQLHNLIVQRGLMSDTAQLTQWPDQSSPQISDVGISVVVVGEIPFHDVQGGPPLPQFFLQVRMNGIWTRLSVSERGQTNTRDVQTLRALGQVARTLEKHVQSFEIVRKLPRNQQWCRWPD